MFKIMDSKNGDKSNWIIIGVVTLVAIFSILAMGSFDLNNGLTTGHAFSAFTSSSDSSGSSYSSPYRSRFSLPQTLTSPLSTVLNRISPRLSMHRTYTHPSRTFTHSTHKTYTHPTYTHHTHSSTKLTNGRRCRRDSDCKSGICGYSSTGRERVCTSHRVSHLSECNSNSDCSYYDCKICRSGKCVSKCSSNQKCNDGRCITKITYKKPECTGNSDCKTYEVCDDGKCIRKGLVQEKPKLSNGRRCTKDSDCKTNYCGKSSAGPERVCQTKPLICKNGQIKDDGKCVSISCVYSDSGSKVMEYYGWFDSNGKYQNKKVKDCSSGCVNGIGCTDDGLKTDYSAYKTKYCDNAQDCFEFKWTDTSTFPSANCEKRISFEPMSQCSQDYVNVYQCWNCEDHKCVGYTKNVVSKDVRIIDDGTACKINGNYAGICKNGECVTPDSNDEPPACDVDHNEDPNFDWSQCNQDELEKQEKIKSVPVDQVSDSYGVTPKITKTCKDMGGKIVYRCNWFGNVVVKCDKDPSDGLFLGLFDLSADKVAETVNCGGAGCVKNGDSSYCKSKPVVRVGVCEEKWLDETRCNPNKKDYIQRKWQNLDCSSEWKDDPSFSGPCKYGCENGVCDKGCNVDCKAVYGSSSSCVKQGNKFYCKDSSGFKCFTDSDCPKSKCELFFSSSNTYRQSYNPYCNSGVCRYTSNDICHGSCDSTGSRCADSCMDQTCKNQCDGNDLYIVEPDPNKDCSCTFSNAKTTLHEKCGVQKCEMISKHDPVSGDDISYCKVSPAGVCDSKDLVCKRGMPTLYLHKKCNADHTECIADNDVQQSQSELPKVKPAVNNCNSYCQSKGYEKGSCGLFCFWGWKEPDSNFKGECNFKCCCKSKNLAFGHIMNV